MSKSDHLLYMRRCLQLASEGVAVAESGMKTAADIALIRQASFDAVLIGEGLHTSAELRDVIWS